MAQKKEPKTFTVKIDDVDVTLLVRLPNLTDLREAAKVYNTALHDALQSKAILREKLDDFMKEQNLWGDEKELEYRNLQDEVLSAERVLASGGIKKSDAKKVALGLRVTRAKIRRLFSIKNNLDANTAQGQADSAKTNYLVSACTVYNDTQKPYFNGLEDYLNRSSEEVAGKSYIALLTLLYGVDTDAEAKLPENKFLREFKYVDDKLRLVNTEGHLVDEDGRPINEEGNYVDKDGNLTDRDGNPVDADGNYKLPFTPFLEDDGTPVIATDLSEVKASVVVDGKDLGPGTVEETDEDDTESDAS